MIVSVNLGAARMHITHPGHHHQDLCEAVALLGDLGFATWYRLEDVHDGVVVVYVT